MFKCTFSVCQTWIKVEHIINENVITLIHTQLFSNILVPSVHKGMVVACYNLSSSISSSQTSQWLVLKLLSLTADIKSDICSMSCRTTTCCHWLSTFWLPLKRSFILSLVQCCWNISTHTWTQWGQPSSNSVTVSSFDISHKHCAARGPYGEAPAPLQQHTDPRLLLSLLFLAVSWLCYWPQLLRSVQTGGASGVTDTTVCCRC